MYIMRSISLLLYTFIFTIILNFILSIMHFSFFSNYYELLFFIIYTTRQHLVLFFNALIRIILTISPSKISDILGKLPVVPVGDTGTITHHQQICFPGAPCDRKPGAGDATVMDATCSLSTRGPWVVP